VKIIKRMFKFENDVHGAGVEWECPIELSQSTSSNRDHFRKPEFQQLYEASLSHGTVKHYHSCTPEERDRLKAALAQRYDKPKTEVTPEDFERANGWKIPSLISVSLDVGFRPIEVGRANIRWFLPILSGNYELDIPKEESTKNENNWRPVVSQRTARAVRLWLDERDSYEKYRETDAMWLTRFGNPYDSNSLNKLLDRLETEAKIDPRGRSLSWYSIRHGVATIWANDVGLHHAREQLRHNSVETTMRYVRSTPDARGEVINGLW
jgi:integrase